MIESWGFETSSKRSLTQFLFLTLIIWCLDVASSGGDVITVPLLFLYAMPLHEGLKWKFIEKNLELRQPTLFHQRHGRRLNAGSNCKWCLGFSGQGKCMFEIVLGGSPNSLSSPGQVFSCYVAEGDMSLRKVSRKTDTVTKVLIPSLPDEPNGESSPITSCFGNGNQSSLSIRRRQGWKMPIPQLCCIFQVLELGLSITISS